MECHRLVGEVALALPLGLELVPRTHLEHTRRALIRVGTLLAAEGEVLFLATLTIQLNLSLLDTLVTLSLPKRRMVQFSPSRHRDGGAR